MDHKISLTDTFSCFCFKEPLLVSQPQCCRTTYDGSSSSASCTFQALGKHLLGMKLSTNNKGKRACIVASHPTTGNLFFLHDLFTLIQKIFWDHQPPEKHQCWFCFPDYFTITGLSFSLTFINNPNGEESELLYKPASLGTFQRVAPEWMREVIKFSTSMCPIFFERVSRVIKLNCWSVPYVHLPPLILCSHLWWLLSVMFLNRFEKLGKLSLYL